MPHLVVSITGHGFGHVAQTAPILNELHRRIPRLRLTVRSSAPLTHLRSRIHAPFDFLESQGDIGMLMSSALDVRIEDSRIAYRDFHANWESHIEKEARLLREIGADLVFSNVGYLPLAGAQRANIPNAALCSLNWSDIYRYYCGDDNVAAQIQRCYSDADAFLRTTPGMAMADLPNLLPIEPIASLGANRRDELNRLLKLAPDEKLVVVSLGGISSRLPMERWPRIDGVRWLVQAGWKIEHPDAIVLDSLPINFGDLLASCDALVSKPGYGSFVEAACSGVPVLYVGRPDWPESPALTDWLKQHGQCREVTRQALDEGNIGVALHELWESPSLSPPLPVGAAQVADWLSARLKTS